MYGFFVQLLQPCLLLYLLVWLAVLNLWRKRREGRGRLVVLTLALLLLTLANTPALGYLAMGTLEWQYPPVPEVPDDAEAIVVLGGTVKMYNEEQGQFLPAADSLYRCWHAVELYRLKAGGRAGPVIPVLVCGGEGDPQSGRPPVAATMADFLRGQGVNETDLLLETVSLSTYENAVEARRVLGPGVRKIMLVTHAAHMARADRCFRKQGFEVVPSPSSFQARHLDLNLFSFLPDPFTSMSIAEVAHEWLGLAWYRLHGRI